MAPTSGLSARPGPALCAFVGNEPPPVSPHSESSRGLHPRPCLSCSSPLLPLGWHQPGPRGRAAKQVEGQGPGCLLLQAHIHSGYSGAKAGNPDATETPAPGSPQTPCCDAPGPSLDRQCQFRPLRHGGHAGRHPRHLHTDSHRPSAAPAPRPGHSCFHGGAPGEGQGGGGSAAPRRPGHRALQSSSVPRAPELATHTGQRWHTDGGAPSGG